MNSSVSQVMIDDPLCESYNRIKSTILSALAQVQRLNKLLEDYKSRSMCLKKQMQYHVNIIDQLHINENSHSRILYEILNYRNSESEYVYLDLLLKVMGERNETFKNIKLCNVDIYQEKFRIDLLIVADRHAVIFENKIYNAADREAQLSRYIDKVKSVLKIPERNIYVIYLSNSGKEPELQSWGTYREDFKDRYLNLSFKDDVRSWIKGIEKDIETKETYLKSAILQYSDYLDGLFNKREINKEINMELQSIIKQNLKIDEKRSVEEKIECLQTELANVDDIRLQMKELIKGYYEEIFEGWKELTKKKYSDLRPNENRTYKVSICEVSIVTPSLELVIGLTDNGERLYCQVEICQKCENASKLSFPESLIKDLINNRILDNSNYWAIWKYFEYDKYEDAYSCFERTIDYIRNTYDHVNN